MRSNPSNTAFWILDQWDETAEDIQTEIFSSSRLKEKETQCKQTTIMPSVTIAFGKGTRRPETARCRAAWSQAPSLTHILVRCPVGCEASAVIAWPWASPPTTSTARLTLGGRRPLPGASAAEHLHLRHLVQHFHHGPLLHGNNRRILSLILNWTEEVKQFSFPNFLDLQFFPFKVVSIVQPDLNFVIVFNF